MALRDITESGVDIKEVSSDVAVEMNRAGLVTIHEMEFPSHVSCLQQFTVSCHAAASSIRPAGDDSVDGLLVASGRKLHVLKKTYDSSTSTLSSQ